MATIKLPCYGIVVHLQGENPPGAGGCIESDLDYKVSPNDPRVLNKFGNPMNFLDTVSRFNQAMVGVRALILSHATDGVDIESPEYIKGIETTVRCLLIAAPCI